MAEFALGLTKTAVEGTLSLVKSAVEEEAKLRDKVQNDLVFITGEFEVMRAFLQVANRERAANDPVVLALVRQLRTLAFDVEDCVEYVVHLDKPSRWGWLRRFWQTLSSRAPPLPLDVAAAEIKQVKARVEEVSLRNTRYNLILHGSDNSDNKQTPAAITVVMPLPAEELPYAAAATNTYYTSSAAAFHALRDAWKATGKWSSNMRNLQQELLIAHEGDSDLGVISVWGSSGTSGAGAARGTVSILTKAYCDPEICKNFKIRIWVKLTHPFNHEEFVKSILAQFYASSSHHANNAGVDFCAWMKATGVTEADNLMKAHHLMQQMREQRYLVVLEDVLTVAEWDVIRMYLPDSKNGSRVLLSTPHLGTALVCTGEPYQVSELRNFSGDNQFLCAFSKKEKTPSDDVGEFFRQLLQGHGVISVWGTDDDEKSNLVDVLYKGIINGWLEEIEGAADDESDHLDLLYKERNRRRKFERRLNSWVDVPNNPFDLKVFAQRLFLNFHSDDIRAKEITDGAAAGLIEWCRKFLSEEKDDPYVVVINGVQSEDDWDSIQSTFFSSTTAMAKAAGCILVITKEETVATHCVKDHTPHLALKAQVLKADPSISALINKGSWPYAIRGKRGRMFYDRRKDAREWANTFENVGYIINNAPDEGKDKEEEGFRVFGVNLCDERGRNHEKFTVLRHAYYCYGGEQGRRMRSWVDVDDLDPFDLTDFSWRLLLDFYSDNPQAKEAIAVGLMEGTITDPTEKCREFLGTKNCLVVINGLRSWSQWESIDNTFFSHKQHIQSIIIVGSAITLGRDDDFKFFYGTKALRLDTQVGGSIYTEYRRIFSTRKRYQDAAGQWAQRSQPIIGRASELDSLGGLLDKATMEGGLLFVWGIPGVGISTLIRTLYYQVILRPSEPDEYLPFIGDDYVLYQHIKVCYEAFAWVDVPSPFNLTEFAWCLLLDFYSDDPQAKETAMVSMMEQGHQVPILECRKILRTGKCFVVIDGLCSKQDWDVIKATFLAEPIKAYIVVITNEEEVAMHGAENNKERAFNIARLESNAALSLFEKIAPQLASDKEASKFIVAKCGGLPKVIAAMRACDAWKLRSLRDNFVGTLETDPEFHGLLRSLFSWMQSYFDTCSDMLKPCIFYLSIFSAEKNIRLRRLLCRWIAEGYCRDTSDGRTCEENGQRFFYELIKLSIIQWVSKVFCQINGFFHEYIISRPMEDNLVFALEEGCRLNSQRAGQHLTIRSTWDRRDRIVYESIDFSRLRSLTVFGKWESFFCSQKVNMRLLRVLDLEDAEGVTNDDLEQIAKLLTRLKFLSLRGCKEITCLPSSMGCLGQLQTLDIRHTSIVMLPVFITKLQKLRYIRAGTNEVWNFWEGDILLAPASAVSNLPAAATATPIEDDEDRASSSAAAAAAEVATNSPPPPPAAGEATQPKEGGTDTTALVSCNKWPCTPNLVSSLMSRLCRHGGLDSSNGSGVKVPAGIQELVVLHTLGVVNVNNGTASATSIFFEELKKLTQLRKLGVSGINKGNILEFCKAISGHAHLKSLSVEVDKDDGNLDEHDIPQPPKAIQSLKLYGRVNKLLLVWMEHLDNMEKLHLTIEKPELPDRGELSTRRLLTHLRIRPIQDGELLIGRSWYLTKVIEIQCSSELCIKFDDAYWKVEVLKVHFSGGSRSSLQISGLSRLTSLDEVWLKGYTDAHKQDMQRQIDEIELWQRGQTRPVLNLVQTRS